MVEARKIKKVGRPNKSNSTQSSVFYSTINDDNEVDDDAEFSSHVTEDDENNNFDMKEKTKY